MPLPQHAELCSLQGALYEMAFSKDDTFVAPTGKPVKTTCYAKLDQ
jgi:hypothetical protein